MKNYIFILMTVLMLSCIVESEDLYSYSEYTLGNSTNHSVLLTVYDVYFYSYKEDTTFILPPYSRIEYSLVNSQNLSFGGGGEDSARIVFDNLKEIVYIKGDGQPRNILDIESWDGGMVKESYYQYQYFITEEDYDNAVLIK